MTKRQVKGILCVIVICFFGCSKDSPKIAVGFTSATSNIKAGQEYVPVHITLGSAPPEGAQIGVSVTLSSGLTQGAGKMIEVLPAPIDNVITLTSTGTTTTFTIYVSSILAANAVSNGAITLQISSTPSGYGASGNKSTTINIVNNSLSTGLVSEYLFNSGLFDTSGKGHDGTGINLTTDTSRHGRPNASYYFDGTTSYASIAANSDVNFGTSQDFSVSLWADPAQVQNESSADILRKWVGDAQGYPFAIAYLPSSYTADPSAFSVARYDGSACGDLPYINSATVTNSYHHVVMVRTGGKFYLYVDGSLASSSDDTTTCATTSNSPMTIGCRGQLVRYFAGHIDDIRIYNRALTGDEITLLGSL